MEQENLSRSILTREIAREKANSVINEDETRRQECPISRTSTRTVAGSLSRLNWQFLENMTEAKLSISNAFTEFLRDFVRAIAEQWEFDRHDWQLLLEATRALDRDEAARWRLKNDGLFFNDRSENPRPHPALKPGLDSA